MSQSWIRMAGALMVTVAGLSAQSAAVQKQPQPKSQKEMEAVMAIFNAADPDGRIKAAEELLSKYADTEFKSVALQVAAASAQEKNDFEKMTIYSERTLEADPKNYGAMLMLATGIPQRTREFDLDKEEKLGRAEKFAKMAQDVLKDAPKPRPDITDEDWTGHRKNFLSQAHEALGLVAMVRKKYDVAVTEFKTSVDIAAAPDPATKVRLGSAYIFAGKYDDAIAVLDPLLAEPELNPVIRQFAQQEKTRAMQGKSGAEKK